MDDMDRYGTARHEAWLLEMEADDDAAWALGEREHPYTPCGCEARAYGGDCAHTIGPDDE